jgi:hypothetical protein
MEHVSPDKVAFLGFEKWSEKNASLDDELIDVGSAAAGAF